MNFNLSFGAAPAISPSLLETVTPGLTIAIIGGFFIFLLNWAKDIVMARLKRKSEARVIAFSLVTEIDRLISGCSEVVNDPLHVNNGGYTETTVRSPTIEFPDTWNWANFPVRLQYRIRSLPNIIFSANSSVASLYEYGEGPPEYTDAYVERTFRFAEIGLEAIEINCILARRYGIELIERGHWDPAANFLAEIAKIVAIREEEAARQLPPVFWMLDSVEQLNARHAKLTTDIAAALQRRRNTN